MGMFLMVAGIAESNVTDVERALQGYVNEKSGVFVSVDEGDYIDEGEILVIAESDRGHVTVVYPSSIPDWDAASQFLSATLGRPVFSLHIHDSDLWMYVLFVNGEEADGFNPIPDYWEEDMLEEDILYWSGDAAAVCSYWPGVSQEQISNYLVRWDLDDDAHREIKAYPEDKYGQEDFQMIDFMHKVGLVYPLDETGLTIGKKYRFKIED